jgi:hypothetical protein
MDVFSCTVASSDGVSLGPDDWLVERRDNPSAFPVESRDLLEQLPPS